MVISVAQDLRHAAANDMYETGDRANAQKIAYEKMEPIARFLGEKPFLVGDYVTFPDFFLFEQVQLFDFICEQGLIKKHPNLGAHNERVANLPGLKEYLASDRCIKRYFNGKRAKINN